MKRNQFKTFVNAPREKVWNTLWGEETYPQWTSAFAEGSKVETDWREGSKILFLNGENEGMVSKIEKKEEHQLMIFKHLGMIDKNGEEDKESDKVQSWAGAEEIYILKDLEGGTELIVELDFGEEHEEFFESAWPEAFRILRTLAESPEENKKQISVTTIVDAPIDKVWSYWTLPQHITMWNQASADWHTPTAENDLRENGKFSYRMEAKDGSTGFDFEGTYDRIDHGKSISYTMSDGRKVYVDFHQNGNGTMIKETFEAESNHPEEMQRTGWQAILDRFKTYVEEKERSMTRK